MTDRTILNCLCVCRWEGKCPCLRYAAGSWTCYKAVVRLCSDPSRLNSALPESPVSARLLRRLSGVLQSALTAHTLMRYMFFCLFVLLSFCFCLFVFSPPVFRTTCGDLQQPRNNYRLQQVP